MAAGAVYDIVLGLSIAFCLRPLSQVLPIPFPDQPFYARVVGILLIGLGCFYSFAAFDLRANIRNVAGAIFIRTLGGFYLATYALMDESVSWFFVLFGATDLAWALVHYVLLRTETRHAFVRLLVHGAGQP